MRKASFVTYGTEQLTFGFMVALNLAGLLWLVQQPPSVWAGLPWVR